MSLKQKTKKQKAEKTKDQKHKKDKKRPINKRPKKDRECPAGLDDGPRGPAGLGGINFGLLG